MASTFVTLLRAFRFATQSMVRNIWLSLVTIFILVLTLFLVSTLTVTQVVADQTLAAVQERVDVSLFFTPDVSLAEVVTLQHSLQERSDVNRVEYISPDDALARFKERNKNNAKLLDTLEALGENPLGPTLVVRAKELGDYPNILQAVNASPIKDKIQDKDEDFETTKVVIERLNSISQNIRQFGLALSLLLSIITLMVVFNTIRVMIYSQREEIGIMKLVGASNTFVRAPFLIEAVLYGVLATAITSAIFFPLLAVVAPTLNQFFSGYDLNIATYFQAHALEVIGIQLAVAVGLSAVSSGIAVGRYLKV
jgi:cell division transport system permease protein